MNKIDLKSINLKKTLYPLAFLLSTILIFIVRFLMLQKSSFPTGLDGFFYALQAKSLVVNGALENPDHEIGYYLCGFFSLVLRNDFIGCKVFSALTSALISLASGWLIFILTKNKKISLLLVLISGASFCNAKVSVNFLNNQFGVLCFLIFAGLFILFNQNCQKPVNKKKFYFLLISSLCFLTLTVLSHLVSAAFAFIFIVLFYLRKLKPQWQIILFSVAAVLAVILFYSQFARFKSVFSFTPILPVLSNPLNKLAGKSIAIEMTVYFIAGWLSTIIWLSVKKKFDFIVCLPVVLFFPFWNLDVLDMGYRMLLNGIPCGLIYIVYLWWDLLKEKSFKYADIPFTAAGVLSVILIFLTSKVYNPKKDPPFKYYKEVIQSIDLPDDSLLIAHLPLNHVYTYYKNLRDCLNYEADFEVPEGKTWRIAYGVKADYLQQFFGEFEEQELNTLIRPLDSEYVLIREDLWQRYLNYEEDEIVESLKNFYNPHTYRPQFIRKSK